MALLDAELKDVSYSRSVIHSHNVEVLVRKALLYPFGSLELGVDHEGSSLGSMHNDAIGN